MQIFIFHLTAWNTVNFFRTFAEITSLDTKIVLLKGSATLCGVVQIIPNGKRQISLNSSRDNFWITHIL